MIRLVLTKEKKNKKTENVGFFAVLQMQSLYKLVSYKVNQCALCNLVCLQLNKCKPVANWFVHKTPCKLFASDFLSEVKPFDSGQKKQLQVVCQYLQVWIIIYYMSGLCPSLHHLRLLLCLCLEDCSIFSSTFVVMNSLLNPLQMFASAHLQNNYFKAEPKQRHTILCSVQIKGHSVNIEFLV